MAHYDDAAHAAPLNDATYPPTSQYLSRSLSQSSSNSSFRKNLDLEKGPSDHTNEGLAHSTQDTVPTRRWYHTLLPKSLPIRLFLGVVIAETIIDLAIQGDILARLDPQEFRPGVGVVRPEDRPRDRVVLFLGIFVFAHVFQLANAFEAVFTQNTLQFLFLTIFNFFFFVYSLIQAQEIREIEGLGSKPGLTSIPVHALSIMIHVTIAVAEVAFIALGWQIWKEFGWKVYKHLGADRNIKRIFFHYQIFLCLIRFDLFFGAAFSIQLIYLVLSKDDIEFYVTIAALPLSIILLALGHVAARYENKILMSGFMVGCVGACVYFAYKLFRIWETANNTYTGVSKSLTGFAAISMLFLLVTFIWACIVMRNFGQGLKVQMSKKQDSHIKRRATTATMHNRNYRMSSHPNRMSIE